MGETVEEVRVVMRDLRAERRRHPHARPVSAPVRRRTFPIARYVHAGRVRRAARRSACDWDSATSKSGPLVRSSYHAWEQVQAAGVVAASPTSASTAARRRHERKAEAERPRSVDGTRRPSDAELHRELLHSMLLIRRFEETARPRRTRWARSAASATSTSARRRWPSASLAALRADDYIITIVPRARPGAGPRHARRAP